MVDSIKKHGIIEPIVVSLMEGQPGKYMLVAGERRYRGAVMAGLTEVPAMLRDEALDVLAEIELEENICRADINFEEEGRLLDKITKLKKKTNPEWGQDDTAEMTGRSTADVSSKIKIAKKFQERPELKAACGDGKMPYTATLKKIKQIEDAERVQRLADSGQIELTTDLRLGNCVDLIKNVKSKSIDMVLTDPPYGLEKLESLRGPGSSKLIGHQLMSDTHNLDLSTVCNLLSTLAPDLARVMKEGAHFYMFCGFQYVGNFISCLEPHLEFIPPIVVWDRGKPSAPAYGYNYMSRLEAIIYGCKPPRSRRLTESMYNVIECSDVPKNLRMYPTEKPVPLLQTLVKQSTSPNGLILDPFAGSGSTLVAAREAGRRGLGFEVDKEAYLRTQARLTGENSDEGT
jgi:site-specific DNA-methyltransferase (adenine-specific)